MPDRELPEDLRQRLSAALESGAPLVSPQPSQAEYAIAATEAPEPNRRLHSFAAMALAAAVVIALVGLQQPREWIVRSVDNITHNSGVPAGTASPTPTSQVGTVVHESPEVTETPEATESPESGKSPQPTQSPEHEQPQPSPTAQPTDGDGDHDGDGGDQSPQPSPSASPSD